MTQSKDIIKYSSSTACEANIKFDGIIAVSRVEFDEFKKEFVALIEKYRI